MGHVVGGLVHLQGEREPTVPSGCKGDRAAIGDLVRRTRRVFQQGPKSIAVKILIGVSSEENGIAAAGIAPRGVAAGAGGA